jgi:hypothetical protein
MTPPRLIQLACPRCPETLWIIDHDYRGIGGAPTAFETERHHCRHCNYRGAGWRVRDKGPASFFLQPHNLYWMEQEEFDKWVAILRTHFPDHPRLADLGKSWYPRVPTDAERNWVPPPQPPVLALRDQSSSKLVEPKLGDVLEWIGMMTAGEFIYLEHRDGGCLRVEAPVNGLHVVRCDDAEGRVVASAGGHDLSSALAIADRYLADDVQACIARIGGEIRGEVGPVRLLLLRAFGKRR